MLHRKLFYKGFSESSGVQLSVFPGEHILCVVSLLVQFNPCLKIYIQTSNTSHDLALKWSDPASDLYDFEYGTRH